MEIERKFLITDLSSINLNDYTRKEIIQDYLYSDLFTAVRKRHIIQDNKHKYVYTVKTGKNKYSVNEIEKEITKQEYDNLNVCKSYRTISKTRYNIPYIDGLIIELDIFHDEYDGVVFAEIEFKSEEQANSIELPKWFGKELSTKLTNAMMAKMSIEEVKKYYV